MSSHARVHVLRVVCVGALQGDVGEGLVVRPVCEVAPAGPGSRALLKRKAPRFLERFARRGRGRSWGRGGAGAGASLLEMLGR